MTRINSIYAATDACQQGLPLQHFVKASRLRLDICNCTTRCTLHTHTRCTVVSRSMFNKAITNLPISMNHEMLAVEAAKSWILMCLFVAVLLVNGLRHRFRHHVLVCSAVSMQRCTALHREVLHTTQVIWLLAMLITWSVDLTADWNDFIRYLRHLHACR